MQSTIDTIIDTLKAGMTTGHDDNDDFWVKQWYTHDPLGVPAMESPAGAVFSASPSDRNAVFVGLDSIHDVLYIKFYQPAVRKQGEDAETASGMTRLVAMTDQAQVLLRTDPTFGSTFVSSKITNVETPLPGISDANVYRIGQITLQITRRAMWGQ